MIVLIPKICRSYLVPDMMIWVAWRQSQKLFFWALWSFRFKNCMFFKNITIRVHCARQFLTQFIEWQSTSIQCSCISCQSIVVMLLHGNSWNIIKKLYLFLTNLSFKSQTYYSDASACVNFKPYQQMFSRPLFLGYLYIPVWWLRQCSFVAVEQPERPNIPPPPPPPL